ncbi:unnamed protein product [Clavelina lepadiformis]|uniref:Uncharacterized protein n=1 Tax=Clavelina lepadiformis TaxID=159417 RepID=A0ABP0FZ67_CLALP
MLLLKSYFTFAVVSIFGASVGNTATRDDQYLEKKNTTTHNDTTETWSDDWNEYWSDWINIGVSDPSGNYSLTEEIEFLSHLHTSFKLGEHPCVDTNPTECHDWSRLEYCTHENSRYRTWMSENCPQSCGICKHENKEHSAIACENKRPSCDILFRFCVGPFRDHMTTWCPRTCSKCNDETHARTLGSTNLGKNYSAKPENYENTGSNATNEVCYPKNCGTVPVEQGQTPKFRIKRSFGLRINRLSQVPYPNIIMKIVGGSRAKKGQWPWHGLLVQQVDQHARFCGITIICKHWLVTAAHCLSSREHGFSQDRDMLSTFSLYVGRHQGLYGYREIATQVFTEEHIDRFIIHPQFRLAPNFSHDIALIKLRKNSPIQYNRFVQPICIPEVNNLKEGDFLTTYGWGATMGRGPSRQYLKYVKLPFISHGDCRDRVWGLRKKGTICAGGTAHKDTCTGDSGGSLVMPLKTNSTSQVRRYGFYGITSYGSQYCNSRTPYKPGIYTDVTYYHSWIREQTNGCCPTDDGLTTRVTPTQESEDDLGQYRRGSSK